MSMETDTAFPTPDMTEQGLTKREYFAIHILAAIANQDFKKSGAVIHLPREAVEFADALIEELDK